MDWYLCGMSRLRSGLRIARVHAAEEVRVVPLLSAEEDVQVRLGDLRADLLMPRHHCCHHLSVNI
jgi:hypothetical protein